MAVSVCILTSAHATFDGRIFHKEAKTLAEIGYDVTLITHHPAQETRNGVEVVPVGEADSHLGRATGLWSMYQTAVSLDADVYHFHDPGLLPVGAALKYRTDSAVVYDCHEDYERAFEFYDFPPDILTPPLVWAFPLIQSVLTQPLDAVVTATDWISEDFTERGHDPVVLLRNFPKITDIEFGEAPIAREHEYVLVYVGGLNRSRGLYRMLDLIFELRRSGYDVGLWLLGHFTDPETESRVHEYVTNRDIDDHVNFVGYVDHADIFSYLQKADLGLAMLDEERAQELIPTKLFEYMYSGLPVITTQTPSTERYLPTQCGEFVPFDDVEKQVSVTEQLLEDRERREEMGSVGRQQVEEKYCWEVEQGKLRNLYADLTLDT